VTKIKHATGANVWKQRLEGKTNTSESEMHPAQERGREREREPVGPTNLGRREVERGGESG
jgi:hypothetical protein